MVSWTMRTARSLSSAGCWCPDPCLGVCCFGADMGYILPKNAASIKPRAVQRLVEDGRGRSHVDQQCPRNPARRHRDFDVLDRAGLHIGQKANTCLRAYDCGLQARERRMEGGPLPLSAATARRRVTDALWSGLSARPGAVARYSLGTLVGRGGLEPPTSAVDTAKRCAHESGGPSVRLRIMWCAESRIASAARMAVDKPHHLTRSVFYRDRCRKASHGDA